MRSETAAFLLVVCNFSMFENRTCFRIASWKFYPLLLQKGFRNSVHWFLLNLFQLVFCLPPPVVKKWYSYFSSSTCVKLWRFIHQFCMFCTIEESFLVQVAWFLVMIKTGFFFFFLNCRNLNKKIEHLRILLLEI